MNPHTVWIPLSGDAEVIQITVAVDNDHPLHHIVEMQLITFSNVFALCCHKDRLRKPWSYRTPYIHFGIKLLAESFRFGLSELFAV